MCPLLYFGYFPYNFGNNLSQIGGNSVVCHFQDCHCRVLDPGVCICIEFVALLAGTLVALICTTEYF